ncbi:hypothetical protein LAZ67_16000354 [Cordylochernes scorpioides]|uniref:Integrase catalytic domain-containing protein n=1 Tax=Cordylochernes scorpioides TaxID=51811 RepID=A0ABY6LAJ2_9ARAC|nr:hypothetical protein LAZ67_16000354 [Cordylochernes scorpioides]
MTDDALKAKAGEDTQSEMTLALSKPTNPPQKDNDELRENKRIVVIKEPKAEDEIERREIAVRIREDLNKPSTSGYKPKFGNQQKQTGNSHNEKAANCLIAKNQEKSEQEWIIDSGATSHMTSCFELLKDSENKEKKIILADDTQIESKAIGNVKIKTKEENLLILKDVLFVPQIKGNLLSVGKLVQDYQRIIFSKDKCTIIDFKDQVILEAPKIYDFYIINSSVIQGMKKIKSSKKPFKIIEKIQTSQSLELLHIDLIGPIKEESIGKARFILTIVYDYSRKLFTRFLKAKSETQEILKEFIEYIENTTNKIIKKFRSDNGTEFNNQELESYLKRKGIEHQRTTFFSPAQNGRCERANRSLIEGTRAQLIESGLPIKFWAEAMNTYTYLKNRTPSYNNTNKTPEEMFTGRKPTVSHLKVFGCKVEFWTPKHKRSKFEKITKTGIFVGYSSCRKAYRICNPENFTITETRDVAFLENQKGAELLTSNEQDSTDYSIIKIEGPAEEETNSSSGDEESSVEIQNPASNTRYNFRHIDQASIMNQV